ncbi:MAG: peptidylprolyl isomerase, partial [Prolixibacteraceae bacterium]|nr:peptidylprolyl isomerase [Prolixibacteraceae bacterium]
MAKREKKSRSKGSLGNNRKAGEDFLFRNAQKDKVVETETGLQYLIVDGGKGIKPTLFDRVKIHQRALLLDGKILEDTYRENKPDEV